MVAQIRKDNYFLEDFESTNLRKVDRVFVLELTPDYDKAKVDTRLADGTNKLHVVKDPQMSMWSFKLDHGKLPDPLKSAFTSFSSARKHAEQYFIKRGVKVIQVID